MRAKVMELSQIEMCALFYNLSTSNWAHHWSQFIPGTNGAGRMFADMEKQRLHVFDSMAGAKTGALKTDSTREKNRATASNYATDESAKRV